MNSKASHLNIGVWKRLMIAKKCSLTLLLLICYLAYSIFVYTPMKSNATSSKLILSFHHTQKITVVYC